MNLTSPPEIKMQLSIALDFALSQLVPLFNEEYPPYHNNKEFSRAGLRSVHETKCIPRVTVYFNKQKIAENQRVYSFVEQDFFELASVEQCTSMISRMSEFLHISLSTMTSLLEEVSTEIVKRHSAGVPPDQLAAFKRRIAEDLSFEMSEYAKTLFCSFVRLLIVRNLGEYTDSFYQDKILEVDVEFDIEKNLLHVKKIN